MIIWKFLSGHNHFVADTCPPRPSLTNGRINYTMAANADGRYVVWTGVVYNCNPGYILSGRPFTNCHPPGRWFPQRLPTCNKRNEKYQVVKVSPGGQVFPPPAHRTITPSTFTEQQKAFVGPNHQPKILAQNKQLDKLANVVNLVNLAKLAKLILD